MDQSSEDALKVAMDSALVPITDIIGRLLGPAADEIGKGLQASVAGWTLKRQIRFWQRAERLIKEAEFEPKPVPPKIVFAIAQNAQIEDDDELQDRWAALLANAANPESEFEVETSFPEVLRQLSSREVKLLDAIFDFVSERLEDFPEHQRNTARVEEISLRDEDHLFYIYGELGFTRLPPGTLITDRPKPEISEKHNKDMSEFSVALANIKRLGLLEWDLITREEQRYAINRHDNLVNEEDYHLSAFGYEFIRACQRLQVLTVESA